MGNKIITEKSYIKISLMKKYLLMLSLYISFVTAVSAQSISGQVIGTNDQPLEFANIVLLQQSDSSFIKGTTSNSDGTFTIQQPNVKVFVRVSYIGYATKYLESQPNMGKIILKADSSTLSEVVVTGHRNMFKMGKEGIITNVSNTPLSKIGTAEDVLKYLPSISKNNDGFNVFGKGKPTFYLNGRQLQDLSELYRLSSDKIKSVEVIQNPGSQYDATTRAVIKIRTLRPSGEGFGASVRSSYSQSQNIDLNEQIDLTYFKNGFYSFATYNFSKIDNYQKSQIEQTVKADKIWNKTDKLEASARNKNHNITAGFNYDINNRHSMGMKYTLSFSPLDVIDTHTTTSILSNNIPSDNIDTHTHMNHDSSPSHNINTFYNGMVWGTNVDLNINYMLSKNSSQQNSDEISEATISKISSKSYIKNQMLAAKLVLGRQLFGGNMRIGIETIHTNRSDNYTIDGTAIISNTYSTLKETQIAPFAEYERNTPIGQINVGTRYEYVDFKYYNNGILKADQSRSFSNLFPYFSLSNKIGNTILNLSYTVKTKRPTYRQLSNNTLYLNRFTLQTGTPTLKPEHIHDVSAMAVWKMLQFMVSWQHNNNAIIHWDEAEPNNSAITRLEYKNLHSLNRLLANIALAPAFGSWYPQLSVGIIKQWLQLETAYGIVALNKPILQIGFNNSVALPHNITINLAMNYQSKGNYQNVYLARSTYALDLSVTKLFFKGALEVNVKGSDLLYLLKEANYLNGNHIYIQQTNRHDSREVGITLRYNFNLSKNSYKGSGAGNSEKYRM